MNNLTKTMSQAISNFETEKVFKEINNDNLNKNFPGFFPSDKINKFVMFIISNIDRSDEGEKHRWNILNTSPITEILLFDSFGITGMKRFIAQRR